MILIVVAWFGFSIEKGLVRVGKSVTYLSFLIYL